MHIAVCGPATLSILQEHLEEQVESDGYPFPGTAHLVLDYLKRGHRVSLVTTAPDVSSTRAYRTGSLGVYIAPSRRRARDRALDFFAQERRGVTEILDFLAPDVVHAHWTYEFGLAARSTPYPSLVTVHDWGPAIARFNKHVYWYFRAAMQVRCLLMPGRLTAPSEYIAGLVRRFYRRECTVVRNGIDLARYAGPRRLVEGEAHVGMLNVGFSSRKNVQAAMLAWPVVRKSRPNATLHLAGPEYEEYGEAWRFADRNGVMDGLVFEGPIDVDRVPAWFGTKDLFLHTSLEESFGVVLCEAMASGVPVIAGKGSGAVEEVTGGAAVLTDVHSHASVADAVLGCLKDVAMLTAMSLKGRAQVVKFEQSTVADHYLSLLELCVRGVR